MVFKSYQFAPPFDSGDSGRDNGFTKVLRRYFDDKDKVVIGKWKEAGFCIVCGGNVQQ